MSPKTNQTITGFASPRQSADRPGLPQILKRPGLQGKRAGMVVFSFYPADPRPRRAVEALLRDGMTVDLICTGDENELKREAHEGLNISRIPIKRTRGGRISYAYQYSAFTLVSAWLFALRSLKQRYDLMYVHNMPDVLVLSSLVPKALGAKVILDLHDPMPELMMTIFQLDQNSWGVRLLSWLEKWSIARVHLVLTVNIACKRLFGSRSCPPEKIDIVMNSPDGEIFPFRAARSYSSSNHDGSRTFVIMYHGSLVERNGLDLAVDALARVRGAIPNAELRIYGREAPFLDAVMNEARNKGLIDCVHYLGSKTLEELVHEIEACDVGVIPNHRNVFTDINTPTRIFEYLALGKPVIAPRTPGIQDYFSEDSLFFFQAGNSEDLAKQLLQVHTERSRAAKIAEHGQQIYLEHSWSKERQHLVDLVSELLA